VKAHGPPYVIDNPKPNQVYKLPPGVDVRNVVVTNNVHSPSHYTTGGIEAIDYIYAKLGEEGFRAYCMGNVLKYVSRWQEKNGIEDLNKAHVYLKWAIDGKPTR
jgi:hypothetical protein